MFDGIWHRCCHGVPFTDERDQEFAQKYHLPIKNIQKKIKIKSLNNYRKKAWVKNKQLSLRDWGVSRQRYWEPLFLLLTARAVALCLY